MDPIEAVINDPMKTRIVFKIHLGRMMDIVVVSNGNIEISLLWKEKLHSK